MDARDRASGANTERAAIVYGPTREDKRLVRRLMLANLRASSSLTSVHHGAALLANS